MTPTVDVIIVNYNTRDRTLECISSVLQQNLPGHRVVLVDNGSTDGSVEAIAAAHPEVLLVDVGENVGFARGVNRGVDAGDGEFVLLLNPDATAFPGSLEALLRFATEHPEHGIYGGRTVREDGTLDPSSCWGAPTLWSLLCFAGGLSTVFRGSELFDPESLGGWRRDSVREVPIVTGCLLLARRRDWELLGGMDERFFLYGEDAEFSARAWKRGFRPVIVPDAVIQHDVGGSTGSSGRKMAMVMAGKVTYLWAVWPTILAVIGILLLQAGSGVRGLLEIATRSRKRTWRDVWGLRASWRRGYPVAERALFGRTPPAGSVRPSVPRPLVVQAEPAFRTQKANPYNRDLYRAMQRRGARVADLNYWHMLFRRTDVVHLHWPDLSFLTGPRRSIHLARLTLFYGTLALSRPRGTVMVWTVHNVAAHEERSSRRIRGAAHRLLMRNIDGILALTDGGLEAARGAYPELAATPGAVTRHGHYRSAYDFSVTREQARERLGLPAHAKVVASVGQIRDYKNVPHLVSTFREADTDAVLLVSGNAPAELAERIRESAGDDPRVRLDLRFLPDDVLPVVLAAADLIVLPYRRIQNSGSAILALSASRPVLVPDLGAMKELQDDVGEQWVRLYEGDLDAEHLVEALDWACAPVREDVADVAPYEWDSIAVRTMEAFEEFRQKSRARNTRSVLWATTATEV